MPLLQPKPMGSMNLDWSKLVQDFTKMQCSHVQQKKASLANWSQQWSESCLSVPKPLNSALIPPEPQTSYVREL